MRFLLPKDTGWIKAILVLLFFFSLQGAIIAKDKQVGWYAGGRFTFLSFISQGSFEGMGALGGPVGGDLIYLPELKNDSGIGINFGKRFKKVAFELSAFRTTHRTSHRFYQVKEASIIMIDLNLKYYFFTKKFFHPFLFIGISEIKMKIKDGAFHVGYDPNYHPIEKKCDAKFNGNGIIGGGGITFHLTSRLWFHIGTAIRFIDYKKAESQYFNVRAPLNILRVSGWHAFSGLSFTIL
jgi:hypothetical protein